MLHELRGNFVEARATIVETFLEHPPRINSYSSIANQKQNVSQFRCQSPQSHGEQTLVGNPKWRNLRVAVNPFPKMSDKQRNLQLSPFSLGR